MPLSKGSDRAERQEGSDYVDAVCCRVWPNLSKVHRQTRGSGPNQQLDKGRNWTYVAQEERAEGQEGPSSHPFISASDGALRNR